MTRNTFISAVFYGKNVHKLMAATIAALFVGAGAFVPSEANNLWNNSVVRQAAVGAAAGGVVGAVSDRHSIGKGAMVGGLTGAGSGAINHVGPLQQRPLVRSTMRGAVIGTGTGYMMNGNMVQGAAIGGAAGAGTHYIRRHMWNRW